MKRALIAGIGNVLLGDDGVGPYVLRLLESQYTFGGNVELADLGTPALDLTHRIVGLHTLVLVDCVASEDHAPGTVLLFRKDDILHTAPAQRLDPHSPALSECLLAAEMLGASPENVLLVGVVGQRREPGVCLSVEVLQAIPKSIAAVVDELKQRDFSCTKNPSPAAPHIWWSESPQSPVTGFGSVVR